MKRLALVGVLVLFGCDGDGPDVVRLVPEKPFECKAHRVGTGSVIFSCCDTETGNLIYARETADGGVFVVAGGCKR